MNITSISQFAFMAYSGAGTPPSNAIAGWTTLGPDNSLISMQEASTAQAQQFNAYTFPLTPAYEGHGMVLQSVSNGLYVVAQAPAISGNEYTTFAATGTERETAAQFAYYNNGPNQYFLWLNPNGNQWYGLFNLANGTSGDGLLVASADTIAYNQPYALPWGASRPQLNWQYTPPGGWWVTPGSDMSWVDFTAVESSEFPFDFSGCILANANLSKKNFGSAKFIGCDLTQTTIKAPLGAASDAWIDFTKATINYPSLGHDWRYLNLTMATIQGFPRLPTPPPQINAQGAILNYLNMIKWNLPHADFSGAQMWNVNLFGANLMGAKFHGTQLAAPHGTPGEPVATSFDSAYLLDADFTDAIATNAKFSQAFLFGSAASLSGASLQGADFSNAFLAEIDFSGIYQKDMVGALFDGACLVGANFQGTKLGVSGQKSFSFVAAALQGADFTGSDLRGADLSNAAIATGEVPPTGIEFPITSSFQLDGITLNIQPITYTSATLLAPTDDRTYCPRDSGPCTGDKLVPAEKDNSPLTSWPVVGSIK